MADKYARNNLTWDGRGDSGSETNMSNKAAVAELEVAEMIVSIGSLEIAARDMDPEQPIFGDGLGLDSIDALELAFRIEQRYGVAIRADREDVHEIFASLRSLTDYINRNLET